MASKIRRGSTCEATSVASIPRDACSRSAFRRSVTSANEETTKGDPSMVSSSVEIDSHTSAPSGRCTPIRAPFTGSAVSSVSIDGCWDSGYSEPPARTARQRGSTRSSPVSWARVRPRMRSAAGLQSTIAPRPSRSMIPSAIDVISER